MTIDYTLHILLWLCSVILPGTDATWVMKGPQGPPLALTQTAEGFHLQPPKGVKAPAVPIRVKGTQVTMGKGGEGMEVDVATLLPLRKPLGPKTLSQVICSATRKSECFDTISMGVGKAQLVYVNKQAKAVAFNFQRVGD